MSWRWPFSKPTNYRNWSPDQLILPRAEINPDSVRIRNIRNVDYKTKDEYTVRHYDKTFELEKIVRAWFAVTSFSQWKGSAHTFVTFEFEDREYIAISAEARKEKNQKYSVIKGILRQYELMYVIADENDLIKLRANHRQGEAVHLYPIRVDRDNLKKIFIDTLNRANELNNKPEFYHTLFNSCLTNIVKHARRVIPDKIPKFRFKVFLPGYSDEIAYRLGLIDTELPLEQIRKKFSINDKVKRHGQISGKNFSNLIRK